MVKSTRILKAITTSLGDDARDLPPVDFASPNIQELEYLFQDVREQDLCSDHRWRVIDRLGLGSDFASQLELLSRFGSGESKFLVQNGVAQMAVHLLPFFQHLIVKCGDKGM